MRIYRIEHGEHGTGLFRTCHGMRYNDIPPGRVIYFWAAGDNMDRHPISDEERDSDLGKYYRRRTDSVRRRWVSRLYYFGTEMKSQIVEWVPNVVGRLALADYGFQIVIYNVDPRYVKRGNYQVAFRRDRGSKIGTVDMETLVEKFC